MLHLSGLVTLPRDVGNQLSETTLPVPRSLTSGLVAVLCFPLNVVCCPSGKLACICLIQQAPFWLAAPSCLQSCVHCLHGATEASATLTRQRNANHMPLEETRQCSSQSLLLRRWNDVLLAPYGATDPVAFYNQAFTTLQAWVLPRLAWLDGAFQGVKASGYMLPSTTPSSVATAG